MLTKSARLLLTSFICLPLISGCAQEPSGVILFNVPENAEGVFILMLDAEKGAKPRVKEGAVDISIPKGGIVRLGSLDFIYKWNQTRIVSKQSVPFFTNSNRDLADDTFGCWFLCSAPDSIFYYLGTFGNKKRIENLTLKELQNHLLK